jgi:hypothetical protein
MTEQARERIDLEQYEPPPHRTESVYELFQLVINKCEDRASNGCHTLEFKWEFVGSDNKVEWEKQKAIRELVVDKLIEEGFVAEGYPENFVDIDFNYNTSDDAVWFVPHYISVEW